MKYFDDICTVTDMSIILFVEQWGSIRYCYDCMFQSGWDWETSDYTQSQKSENWKIKNCAEKSCKWTESCVNFQNGTIVVWFYAETIYLFW